MPPPNKVAKIVANKPFLGGGGLCADPPLTDGFSTAAISTDGFKLGAGSGTAVTSTS